MQKTLNAAHTQPPRVVNVDKNAAYPPAIEASQADEQLPKTTDLLLVKYLNNRVKLSPSLHQAIDSSRNEIPVGKHGTTNFERV